MRAVYPGSFDPPTVAHVAIAAAAVASHGLVIVDFTISVVALAKAQHDQAPPAARLAELQRLGPDYPWLRTSLTDSQLLVDIASGYDAIVMGADKWHQIHDVAFYETTSARDAAIDALPHVLLAGRGNLEVPKSSHRLTVLDLPEAFGAVSSTAVRAGKSDWRARQNDSEG